MIKLYFYRLGGFLTKAAFSSVAEKNRWVSKKAYELLIENYRDLTGEMPVIKKTDRGKPYIDNSGYHISLSHTGNFISIAVSDCPIGVDVEVPRQFSEHMTERVFSESEIAYIRNGDSKERATALWTMREAVCKVTGEGLSDWFFNCSFTDNNAVPVSVYFKDDLMLNLKKWKIDDCILTVAAVSSLENIEFFENEL